MNYPSPRTPGSTPGRDWDYSGMTSATPTPSPRPNWFDASTPRRPQTRAAHTRGHSYSQQPAFSPRPPRDSPRYNSYGEYATADSTPLYPEAGYSSREASYEPPPHQRPYPPQTRPPTSFSHARRSSSSNPVPQRPSTARPSSGSTRAKPPSAPKATEYDARRYKIPSGYSLKNWDPAEEPILLLGSVFDANSLGKWIYDWTVYREGPGTPISDMAGELWLILIQFSGKLKRAEDIVGRVRSVERRDTMNDFIDAGERLMDKLRALLKACEAPMLKAARKSKAGLGKNSGVEFVDTLFGRDRELSKTEKFMQSVRLFNLRFDANCEEIVQEPSL